MTRIAGGRRYGRGDGGGGTSGNEVTQKEGGGDTLFLGYAALRDVSKYRYSRLTKATDYWSRPLALSTLTLTLSALTLALTLVLAILLPVVGTGAVLIGRDPVIAFAFFRPSRA